MNVGVAEQNMISMSCGLREREKSIYICLNPLYCDALLRAYQGPHMRMNLPIVIIGERRLVFWFRRPYSHAISDIA